MNIVMKIFSRVLYMFKYYLRFRGFLIPNIKEIESSIFQINGAIIAVYADVAITVRTGFGEF